MSLTHTPSMSPILSSSFKVTIKLIIIMIDKRGIAKPPIGKVHRDI